MPRPDPRATARRHGHLIVAGTVMAGLSIWGLGRSSMYSGEAATRWAATLRFAQLRHLLDHVDAVHALYYAGMHVWLLAGHSVTMLRLPSAAAMTAAVVLTALLGARLTRSRRVGLLAGLLLALVPFIDSYAQNARSYAIDTALVLLTVLALLRALEQPTWRRFAGYGLLVSLTGWLHEMTLLAVLAHGITVLWAGTPRPVARRWAVSAAAGVAAVVPLIVISRNQSEAVAWIRRTRFADVPTLLHDFFGTSTLVAMLVGLCAVVGAVPARSRAMSIQAVAVPLALVPPLVLMVESAVGRPLYDPRYVIYCIPAGALLAAAGLDRLGRAAGRWLGRVAGRRLGRGAGRRLGRGAGWVPGLALCLVALTAQWSTQQYLRTNAGRPQDLLAAADFVQSHSHRGDGLLFIANNFRNTELGYTQQFRGLDDFSLRRSPAASGTFRGVLRPAAVIASDALRHARIWVVGLPRRHYRGLSAFEVGLLRRDFRRQDLIRFHGIDVALYGRSAAPR